MVRREFAETMHDPADGGAPAQGDENLWMAHRGDPPSHPHQPCLNAEGYRLTQLRYDLRKMRAHGLLEREGKRCAYRLTAKGTRVALLFVLFHKRVCGPLAHNLFNRPPESPFQS